MAKRFTRNIRSIKDIEKQPKNTNEQNDLLSDDKHVYVRNKDKYENLTNSVKSVNDETIDENGNVEIDTGVHKVNQETADDSGNVEIDTGVMQVNGKEPDEEGHILIEASDIPDNQNLARKEYVKKEISKSLSKFENEYLVMTDTFENAFPDKKKTRLQYVLQGGIMQIFGLIRTKKELDGKIPHVVGKISDKFNPIIEGFNYGVLGARYHFKTIINDQNHSEYPNKITIRDITNTDNQYANIPADEDRVFYISLTIGVEING